MHIWLWLVRCSCYACLIVVSEVQLLCLCAWLWLVRYSCCVCVHIIMTEVFCAKARAVLGLLYRKFHTNCNHNQAMILQLYKSPVHPDVEYAYVQLHGLLILPRTLHAMLENLQRFARKMATWTHNWGNSYEEIVNVDWATHIIGERKTWVNTLPCLK